MNAKFVVVTFQRLKWSVSLKIGACFAFLVVLIIAGNVMVFLSILNLEKTSGEERQKSLELDDATTFNEELATQLISYNDAIYLIHQPQVNSTYTVQAQSSMSRLSADDPVQLNQPNSLLFRLNKKYNDLSNFLNQLDTLLRRGDFSAADNFWTQNEDLRNSTPTIGAQLQKQIEDDSAKLLKDSAASSTFTKIVAIVVGLLSVLFAVSFAWLIAATIGRPLAATRRYLEFMSVGDFNSELNLDNRDELGDMAKALNLSVKTLRGIIESFNIGSEVAEASSNLKYISTEQSDNANQQVSYVTQIGSTLTEFSREAGVINDNAGQVATAAQTTFDQARYVAVTTSEVTTTVEQLKKTVDRASTGIEKATEDFSYIITRLDEVEVQSQRAEAIVSIITGITSEIHLLALNAAIEAAGAGEFGTRFSVIAREVKQLAARSSKATEQVKDLIAEARLAIVATGQEAEQRQQSISAVMNLGSEVEKTVEEALHKVNSNQSAVEAILKAAKSSSVQASQIKAAAYAQQMASQEILTTINAILDAVKVGADSSNKIAFTSSELENLSHSLAVRLTELKMPLVAATS